VLTFDRSTMKLTLSLLLLTSIAFAAETPAKKAETPAKKAPAKKVYPQNPPPTVAEPQVWAA
jgi:hypothetical protein